MNKLIYNSNHVHDYDECRWVLFKNGQEFPFRDDDEFDKDHYPYTFYVTDIIVCEYE